ncbi:biliverdin-producing heme oxygenase [Cyanobium sp. ULC084]
MTTTLPATLPAAVSSPGPASVSHPESTPCLDPSQAMPALPTWRPARASARGRRLHARIGAAHHQAEGMAFSRALLDGQATPLQLAALVRALGPGYALIEQRGPELGAALGAIDFPWAALARSAVLAADAAALASAPATPSSAAAALWLAHLQVLAQQAPHRFLAHVYVRYGGDLSGGQQLAQQANAILAAHGLPAVRFWAFDQPLPVLKAALHDAFEQLDLSEAEEGELLDEAVVAFQDTQRLLAELGDLAAA